MQGIKLSELKHDATPATIAVQSLEGDIYLSYAVTERALQPIVTDDGERLRARSIAQMHHMLRDVPVARARLLMDSPYDEMIGLQAAAGAEGVPLSW